MNRSIAVFLGLMVLLAHALAIHGDGSGGLAPVYDRAYAELRFARSLVYEGALRWNHGAPPAESVPSVVWCLWLALGERLQHFFRFSMNHWAQVSGLAAALATVVLAARFHVDRVAGAIGPLLLVTSGSLAAAATAGTEHALLAFALTAAFVAQQRGWSGLLALAAAFTCALAPAGTLAIALLFATRFLPRRPDEGALPSAACYLPAALCVVGAAGLRLAFFGTPWSPLEHALLGGPALAQGLRTLRSFFLTSGSPLLVVAPVWYLLRGRLTSSGRDALLVGCGWLALCAWIGGGPLPFFALFVPALPLLFHAVQEGLLCALDSTRSWLRRGAIGALFGGIALGALASAFPGERGLFLPGEAVHEAWMANPAPLRPGYAEPRGRLGLAEELRVTRRLHAIGIYLRDSVEPGTSVLTPWPGAIAYLSHLPVWDMLGRATPLPGTRVPRAWERPGRVDALAWLEREPELVVPSLVLRERPPSAAELADEWLETLDARAQEPGRREALLAALGEYELVTVPIYEWAERAEEWLGTPFHLLRLASLHERPQLELALEDEALVVSAMHEGARQIVDLALEVEDAGGESWYRRPTGSWTREAVVARRALLVYPAGGHRVELVRAPLAELPAGVQPRRARAVLLNPRASARLALEARAERGDFAAASDVIELPLR